MVSRTAQSETPWPLGGRVADEATIRRLQRLAYWLDDRYQVPGTNRRVGLDGLIGLVPGIGDAATGALSAYIIYEAWRLGVPRRTLIAMLRNLGIDVVVGGVPVFGDLFDMAWKANKRNVALLLRHLEQTGAGRPGSARS